VCVCVCVWGGGKLVQMKSTAKYKRTEKERVKFSHWLYGRSLSTRGPLHAFYVVLSRRHDQRCSSEYSHFFCVDSFSMYSKTCSHYQTRLKYPVPH
jgi:hypothetical protein